MDEPQTELPDRGIIKRPALIDRIEERIMRSGLAQAEQVALIRYLNFSWLEQHRHLLVARLREQEPQIEQTARRNLRAFYSSPMQRFKKAIHRIGDDAVDAAIERQTRQAVAAKAANTTMLGYALDPDSPHYFRRKENAPDERLRSNTAREILQMIRAYDWRNADIAPARSTTPPGVS